MAKLVISRNGSMLGSHFLESARLTIGRAIGSDVQLDDASVSKQHALIEIVGNDHILQDLGSANGTLVNGARVSRHLLRHGDAIEVCEFQMRYVDHKSVVAGDGDRTMVIARSNVPPTPQGLIGSTTPAPSARAVNLALASGTVRGIAGKMAGKELLLDRPVIPIGEPGNHHAAIFRRLDGFYVARVEGEPPRVNGKPIAEGWQPLANGDFIELADDTWQVSIGKPA